ncbi:hypothetical protein HK101_011990 [Irineochytrium annulatum]|nr:hypothetical protein HK101_011990 [Irineochytrium annulatum]
MDAAPEVDALIESHLLVPDHSLDHALQTSSDADLPQIAVSPCLGKFLYLLAAIHAPKRILEIGTLGGYSTLWLAKALCKDNTSQPRSTEHRLVTLELLEKNAGVARANFAHAGVAELIDVVVGDAVSSLKSMEGPPFDFVFIDADKQGYPTYLRESVRLARPGAVIVLDNMVRKGNIVRGEQEWALRGGVRVDEERANVEGVLGTYGLLEELQRDGKVESVGVQTVGRKGYDGFVLLRVL